MRASRSLASGSVGSLGPGLASAEAVSGAGGAAARTPLVAGLIEASSSPTAQAAANAGSSVASGAAPLTSMGQGASAGGASKAGLGSATAPEKDENDDGRAGPDDQQSGERVL